MDSLGHIAENEEIVIGFVRPDATKGSTPIWIVEVDGRPYVRSGGGTSGGWYRRLRRNPDGEVRAGGQVYPVRAEPVEDAALREAVTDAYRVKYQGSPLLDLFTKPDSVQATFRLLPR
jgi:hypothetical protein